MAAAATAARTFTRTAFRFAPATATFRASATRTSTRITPLPRQAFRQQSRRGYADSASPNPNNTHTARGGIILGVGIAALGGASYYYYEKNPDVIEKLGFGGSGSTDKVFTPKFENYQEVYNAIAQALEEKDDYDDGSYGPVLLRLAWHASGTYDKETGTGGSNGATMRFDPEGDHGANAGLKAARDFLEPIKAQFPWISHSDLWTLAGVCAIQEMQGPTIPWRPGRQDRAVSFCTPDGRLPDGAKEQTHLRAIFGRMGFTDQEIVALSGAHALGRCHTDRSGFSGPWTFSPTVLTNDYYKLLVDERWQYKKWDGPRQFEDSATRSLMMLPTDMALVRDRKFRAHVERYARDNEAFFRDFGDVVMRLFELGVPFASGEEARWKFKPATGLD